MRPLFLLRVSLLIALHSRIGRFRKAHEVYIAGCAARFLDYPEYLLEAWLSFEKQNGTLSDLEFTLTKVKRQQKRIAARRQTVRF